MADRWRLRDLSGGSERKFERLGRRRLHWLVSKRAGHREPRLLGHVIRTFTQQLITAATFDRNERDIRPSAIPNTGSSPEHGAGRQRWTHPSSVKAPGTYPL